MPTNSQNSQQYIYKAASYVPLLPRAASWGKGQDGTHTIPYIKADPNASWIFLLYGQQTHTWGQKANLVGGGQAT